MPDLTGRRATATPHEHSSFDDPIDCPYLSTTSPTSSNLTSADEGRTATPTEGTEMSGQRQGYEVWKAMIEDAVERGEVKFLQATTIAGRAIPADYWIMGYERHPRVHLYDAAATLASACACRGRLHAGCVWPTIQRGEQPDMPEDWREWAS